MRLLAFAPLALLTAACACAQATVRFPRRIFDIRRFGADTSESKWLYDTGPIQKAIDACGAAGGGTVVIPKGNWLVGPLFLRSHVRLELQRGAELAATTEDAVFRRTAANARWAANSYVATLNVADAEDVAIVGEGRIDGQGAVWWEKWRAAIRATGRRPGANRPRLVYVTRSRNILIQGVQFFNSPSFHLVFKDCENVTIDHVQITALAHSPNTDAIDPIDTSHVLITHNVIDCGDDVVAVKSTHAFSEDIRIADNRVVKGRGISIGSETMGGVRRVTVENNEIHDSMYGIRTKTPRGRGGDVGDILFRNNRLIGVETPIVFSGYYESLPNAPETRAAIAAGGFVLNDQLYPGDRDPARPFVANRTPAIHDVTVDGLTATGADRAGLIIGLPESPLRRITLRHVHIEATTGLRVRHAQVAGKDISVEAAQGPAVILEAGASVTGIH